ncbi:MAG: hypothetical protein ABJM26_04880 [Anderseniella sp.]|uniref:hypothetical protein n=1 Tax=Marinobacter sp. TaxID=50741 RepID=UPI00329475D3
MDNSSDKQKIVEALTLLGSVKGDAVRVSLDRIELELVKCLSGVSASGDSPAISVTHVQSSNDPQKNLELKPTPDDMSAEFEPAGASKVEAAVHIIRTKGRSCMPVELIEEMQVMGIEDLGGDNASPSLIKALARRANKTGDIFKVPGGGGAWDLTEHYTPNQITALLSSVTANEALAKEKQRERTLAGMERAKARGKRLGKKPKITAEMAGEFKRMRVEKVPIKEACTRLGISAGTYYKYKNDIMVWNVGDPWPPVEKPDSPFRVVK